MDWFHCNQCFRKSGAKFAISSCGHICCEACFKPKQCGVCGASCSYLPITDEMKPQEKVFFKDPVKLIMSRMQQICQIAIFQKRQMAMVITHFKNKSSELEKHLKEVTEQSYRQISELKRENAAQKKQISVLERQTKELKKPLSQRTVLPARFQTDGTHRVSLPVAVTSPVTPRSRTMSQVSSAESQRSTRGLLFTTPGSASMSSTNSLHEYTFSTPPRTQTPLYQLPFLGGMALQSPRR